MKTDSTFECCPLATCPLGEVADVLSRSFHESEAFASSWADEMARDLLDQAIDTDLSRVTKVEGEVVAVCLVSRPATDEARIPFCGVLPPFRRKGIAEHTVIEALRLCRESGVLRVWLEVHEENRGAISLWQKLGFGIDRQLHQLRADGHRFVRKPWPSDVEVRYASTDSCLEDYERFHRVRVPWAKSPERLRGLGDRLCGWEVLEKGVRRGYLLQRGASVEDLAIDEGAQELLPCLLEAAWMSTKTLRVSEIPDDDPLAAALMSRGFLTLATSLECSLAIQRAR